VKELRGPNHAGERLALHATCVRIGELGLQVGIEFVGLGATKREHLVEIGEWRVDTPLMKRRRTGAAARAGRSSRESTPAFVPSCSGQPASFRPCTRNSWNASLK